MLAKQNATMKSHANYLLFTLWVTAFSVTLNGTAATLWTGPPTSFANVAGTDPNQAANQDRITPNVWITRSSNQGLWNAATEFGFAHFSSPQGTQWSDGSLANYASLSYTDWNTWAKIQHGGPFGTVGVSAVVHLVADDIYLSVTVTSWGGPGGGFSYSRSTPPAANQPPTVAITSPATGASFTAPALVPINASASDSDGSVTNVQFFDGTTLLGATNNTPYTVTANLALGSHTLTAVATDNGGLSTTSSVVNVTVNTGTSAPSLTIQMTGDLLDISWPEAGGRLQAQTNGLAGNWADVPDSTTTNRIVAPIDRLNGSVYYRLALP
jgi:hypothetical protein